MSLPAYALLVLVVHFAVAWLGIVLSRELIGLASVWYADAVSTCLLLARPRRDWPALLAAVIASTLSADLLTGSSFADSQVFLIGDLTELCLGAELLRRYCTLSRMQTSVTEVVRVLLLGVVLPSIAGALAGALAHGMTPGASGRVFSLLEFLLNWLHGSLIGGVAVLPLGLLLLTSGPNPVRAVFLQPKVGLAVLFALAASVWAPRFIPLPYIYVAGTVLLVAAMGQFPATAVTVLLCSVSLRVPLSNLLYGPAAIPSAVGSAELLVPQLLVLFPPLCVAALLENINRMVATLGLQEQHFRRLYQKSPVMLHSVDLERKLIEVNDAWLLRMGYAREDVLGRPALDFLTPESRKHVNEVISPRFDEEGIVNDIEYQVVTSLGEIVDVAVSAIWETDNEGRRNRTMTVWKDVTETRELTRKMSYLALHDTLTGLPNRLLLQDRMNQAAQVAARNRTRFAIMFMDLDHFKRVNDLYGHPVGDQLLASVGESLRQSLRASDTVCRLGGDEFVMLVTEMNDHADAEAVAQKVLADVAQLRRIDGHEISVSFSLGVAVYPDDGLDPDTLMRHADTAMYRSKRQGRNRIAFFAADLDGAVRVGDAR